MGRRHKQEESESEFIQHLPCDNCGSSDANALYDDDHTHCFSCGTTVRKASPETKAAWKAYEPTAPSLLDKFVPDEEFRGIDSRKIFADTCEKFKYRRGTYNGMRVQAAPFFDKDGQLCAWHLRGYGKKFFWIGDSKAALPFGSTVWQKTGKQIIVTEGECDTLAMSQVQGNKYPVVSISCGAAGVRKYMGKHREYFMGFDKVVIMFDNDEPGREAAEVAAEVLGSRAHIAELPLKDASDMVREDRTDELIDAMWRAKKFCPQGIVELRDLKDKAVAGVPVGKDWFSPKLTKLTHGWRYGELYALGAATAAGKTDWILQQVAFNAEELKEPTAVFLLEQQPVETSIRLCGKLVRKPLHADTSDEGKAAIAAAWEQFNKLPAPIYAYDSFGINDWSDIQDRMRFLNQAEGVRFFVLDHITALAAGMEDERKMLDALMADLGGLVKELDSTILFVSHLATPDGKPHEEGGRVMLKHFRGSRSIAFWTAYAFGLERDQQAEDEEIRRTTFLRVLKDRWLGRATGHKVPFQYDFDTGMLNEADTPEDEEENMVTEFDDETEGTREDDF